MRWTMRSACELPVIGITQRFVLLPGSLSVRVRVDGIVRRSGFEVPCLITAGDSVATVTMADRCAVVGAKGWLYRIEVPAAEVCTQDPVVRANRNAQYRVLRYETSVASFAVRLTLSRA